MAPVTRKAAVLGEAGAKFDHAYAARNAAPRAGRSPSRRVWSLSENPGPLSFALIPQVWQKPAGRTNHCLVGSAGLPRTLIPWFPRGPECRKQRREEHGKEGALRAGDLLLGRSRDHGRGCGQSLLRRVVRLGGRGHAGGWGGHIHDAPPRRRLRLRPLRDGSCAKRAGRPALLVLLRKRR